MNMANLLDSLYGLLENTFSFQPVSAVRDAKEVQVCRDLYLPSTPYLTAAGPARPYSQ